MENTRVTSDWHTMRGLFCILGVFGVVNTLVAAPSLSAPPANLQQTVPDSGTKNPDPPAPASPTRSDASLLLDIALDATARSVERSGARPTISSRELAIAVTAMYDAWAAYDAHAVGTRWGDTLRRPPNERTNTNKKIAMAFGLLRSLEFVFPEDVAWIHQRFSAFGIDPRLRTLDRQTPVGIGNSVAAAVMDFRRNDGSNQFGTEVGSNGKPYSDWTFYTPMNPPGKMFNPDCWQPIPFDNGKGGTVTIGFLTPHWYRVSPFGLDRADQFRPGPPPRFGDPQLKKEVDEVLHCNAHLTVEQKAIVEFMRDGPKSTGQSGHWLRFAQMASVRKGYNIDDDAKLFFAVANTAFDAFIAAWDTKRAYDSSRPWSLVRTYYAGQNVKGWGGPGKGVVEIPAEEWHPYSPFTFVTPPFPGYVSGHSTVSAACAKILELSTGSDQFGEVEKRRAGDLTEPGVECKQMQARFGALPKDDRLTCEVALRLPTFSATAEMAGISRVLGGYHIQSDNIKGLELGRKVAVHLWPKFQTHFRNPPRVSQRAAQSPSVSN